MYNLLVQLRQPRLCHQYLLAKSDAIDVSGLMPLYGRKYQCDSDVCVAELRFGKLILIEQVNVGILTVYKSGDDNAIYLLSIHSTLLQSGQLK